MAAPVPRAAPVISATFWSRRPPMSCLGRRDAHRHPLDAVDEVRLEVLGLPRDLELGYAPQQLLEHHPDLAAGEVRAEAEVRSAAAEPDVLVRVAAHVERVRVGEDRRVAVGRAVPEDDLL